MKYLKKFEDIKIPIEVGDNILGGRFKNKRILVKKIGKNKKGDITINDKPLLKFRLLKESISQEDIDNGLAYLKDDGFQVLLSEVTLLGKLSENKLYDYIEIFKLKETEPARTNYGVSAIDNMVEVKWSDIESDLLPFVELNKDFIKEITITMPYDTTYDRISYTPDIILEDIKIDKLIKIAIILKK